MDYSAPSPLGGQRHDVSHAGHDGGHGADRPADTAQRCIDQVTMAEVEEACSETVNSP